MTDLEWIEHRRRMDDARYQRNRIKTQDQQLAAERACRIWNNVKPADLRHPYLLKKIIAPFLARQRGNSLILPVIDIDNKLWSLQFIDPNGSKLLLSGGAKKGNFIPINRFTVNSQLFICEGFATGATLSRLYRDACIIAAIDAGNLEAVAISARRRMPGNKIVIFADDDRQTAGNPGITKGRRAAIASGALLATPQWPDDAPKSLSDMNDLAC